MGGLALWTAPSLQPPAARPGSPQGLSAHSPRPPLCPLMGSGRAFCEGRGVHHAPRRLAFPLLRSLAHTRGPRFHPVRPPIDTEDTSESWQRRSALQRTQRRLHARRELLQESDFLQIHSQQQAAAPGASSILFPEAPPRCSPRRPCQLTFPTLQSPFATSAPSLETSRLLSGTILAGVRCYLGVVLTRFPDE